MHRLIQISDTHLSAQHGFFFDNFQRVATAINAAPPDIVVSSGDLSVNGPETEEDLDFALWAHHLIEAPVRFLPGNHDVGEEPGGEHLDQPITHHRLAVYQERFGPCRWRERLGDWLLLGINSQLFNTGFSDEDDQWQWLDAELSAHRGPVGLFLHKPLFAEGPGEAPQPATTVSPRVQGRLHDLLLESGARFVACGHVHQRQTFSVDGIAHHWCPSTAFQPAAPRDGCDPALGFLEYKFEGNQYTVEFRSVRGLDAWVLEHIKENGKYAFLKDVPPQPVTVDWRRPQNGV